MKFIEIKNGYSVKKDAIDSIQRIVNDEGNEHGSIVTLRSGETIETGFYYKSLLMKVEADFAEVVEVDQHETHPVY